MVYAMGNQLRKDALARRLEPEELEENGIDLEALGRLDWTSKNREVQFPYVKHALMVTKFRTCLEVACREGEDLELLYWYADRQVKDKVFIRKESGEKEARPIHPDGFFCVSVRGEKKWFFLEADRHTMPQKRSSNKKSAMFNKLQGYWEFWGQKRFKDRESPFAQFKMNHFRALFITKSEKRAENLLEVAREADPKKKGSALFMVTSQENYDLGKPGGLFENIWGVPGTEGERFSLS